MKPLVLLPFLLVAPGMAAAESTLIDTGTLPSRTVWDAAELTPLAMTQDGAPAIVLLSLDAGAVVPPRTRPKPGCDTSPSCRGSCPGVMAAR